MIRSVKGDRTAPPIPHASCLCVDSALLPRPLTLNLLVLVLVFFISISFLLLPSLSFITASGFLFTSFTTLVFFFTCYSCFSSCYILLIFFFKYFPSGFLIGLRVFPITNTCYFSVFMNSLFWCLTENHIHFINSHILQLPLMPCTQNSTFVKYAG